MLERFNLLRRSISIAIQDELEAPDMISASQFAVIEEIIDVFRPFYLVTIDISAEKSATISKVIPIFTTCIILSRQ